MPIPAWIQLRDDALNGTVRSAVGRLFRVAATINFIDARTNAERALAAGWNYMVESISDGVVTLRPEVPADMPCGSAAEELMKATDATPRDRVAIERLFDGGGKPLLSPAYPRGC